MSNVVISNRSIFNQRIINIEQNKVLLPFNVTKEQINKLSNILSKTKITFNSEPDNLKISSLIFNNINIKTSDRQINNSRFTLSKTYVVTMKQGFISKVKTFYKKIVEEKVEERPVFNIGKETNLQQALQEATAEIDLSTINVSLNAMQNVPQNQVNNTEVQPNPQVLANNPLGETIIENPVNLNSAEPKVEVQTPMDMQNNMQPVNNANVIGQTPAQNVAPQQENLAEISVPLSQVNEVAEPVKKKRKIFSKKGNVLAVPIVVIWLGLVFFGTLKLVTSILT